MIATHINSLPASRALASAVPVCWHTANLMKTLSSIARSMSVAINAGDNGEAVHLRECKFQAHKYVPRGRRTSRQVMRNHHAYFQTAAVARRFHVRRTTTAGRSKGMFMVHGGCKVVCVRVVSVVCTAGGEWRSLRDRPVQRYQSVGHAPRVTW